MKIFYSLNSFSKDSLSSSRFAITIGVFDGLHRAHQKVIRHLIKKAKSHRLKSALITFNPHPLNALGSSRVPQLTSLEHRLRLLKKLGLDCVIIVPFNKRFARTSAADFVKKIVNKIRIDEIIVGGNFFFGKDKAGSLEELKQFSGHYGYKVSFVRTIKSAGKTISSTLIRNLILRGKLKEASKLLSRPVAVLGTVAKGHRRGRIIGYPTANIDPHHEAIPPSGVYAVRAKLGRRVYNGITNIGTRPTFVSGKDPTIEVHIFGFNRHIYGRDMEVIFVKKIREEKRFKNMHLLRAQIRRDEAYARRILHT